MLSDHVNIAAASKICETSAQSMGADGLHYFFAVDALVEAHFFSVSRSFAVFAGLVGFFASDVEGPEAEL